MPGNSCQLHTVSSQCSQLPQSVFVLELKHNFAFVPVWHLGVPTLTLAFGQLATTSEATTQKRVDCRIRAHENKDELSPAQEGSRGPAAAEL